MGARPLGALHAVTKEPRPSDFLNGVGAALRGRPLHDIAVGEGLKRRRKAVYQLGPDSPGADDLRATLKRYQQAIKDHEGD